MEHQCGLRAYWSPALKTSVYGGYVNVDYNGTANGMICAQTPAVHANAAAIAAGAACNPDYSFWQVGSRTQWSPWKGQLNIGVDVFYTKINTAFSGLIAPGVGPRPATVLADEDILGVAFRVQRNFYP